MMGCWWNDGDDVITWLLFIRFLLGREQENGEISRLLQQEEQAAAAAAHNSAQYRAANVNQSHHGPGDATGSTHDESSMLQVSLSGSPLTPATLWLLSLTIYINFVIGESINNNKNNEIKCDYYSDFLEGTVFMPKWSDPGRFLRNFYKIANCSEEFSFSNFDSYLNKKALVFSCFSWGKEQKSFGFRWE